MVENHNFSSSKETIISGLSMLTFSIMIVRFSMQLTKNQQWALTWKSEGKCILEGIEKASLTSPGTSPETIPR